MLNKILMELGFKEKDLATYLQCSNNIEKIVNDGEYTVTVVKDAACYDIRGWKYGKSDHSGCTVCRPIHEDAKFFNKIDKMIEVELTCMKKHYPGKENYDKCNAIYRKVRHIKCILGKCALIVCLCIYVIICISIAIGD